MQPHELGSKLPDIKSLKSNNVLTQEEFENMILKLNSKILKDFN